MREEFEKIDAVEMLMPALLPWLKVNKNRSLQRLDEYSLRATEFDDLRLLHHLVLLLTLELTFLTVSLKLSSILKSTIFDFFTHFFT
jgi:prolyl-tRNA synthetase